MEPKNEQIRKTLMSQYSKFLYLSPTVLSERMKQPDWWAKEEYRVNIQQKAGLVGITVGIMLFLFVILTSIRGGSVPVFSFMTYTISFFILIITYSRVEERSRMYKVMCLAFEVNR